MSKIEMGKQYRTVSGKKARVICLDWKGSNLPVLVLVEIKEDKEALYSYTIEGRYYSDGDSEFDLVEYDPAMDLKVDQPIWVRNYSLDRWLPRHFCKYKDGQVWTFREGRTSHSSGDVLDHVKWKFYTTQNPNA